MDGACFEKFLEERSSVASGHHLLLVLDNAPRHTPGQISHPENVSLLALPAYSAELTPGQRWFEEFRRALANEAFETIDMLQEALTKTLEPYWLDRSLLRQLTGTPGGWQPSKRRSTYHDINQPDWYKPAVQHSLLHYKKRL